MPATVIVGLQWGDEGKGKTTDFLAEQTAMVVRYQGGDNAGHTVVVGDEVSEAPALPLGRAVPAHHVGDRQRRRGQPGHPHPRAGHARRPRRRHGEGPREPQRARDHAVPRGPRPGEREPPRGRQGGHDRSRHRADVRRPRLAPGPADGGPGRRAPSCASASGGPSWTRTCCSWRWVSSPSRWSRSSPRAWRGASASARTSTTRPGSSRTRCGAATTSSSRAPRARCWTSTTAAIPSSPHPTRSPAAPAPVAASARSRWTRSSGS